MKTQVFIIVLFTQFYCSSSYSQTNPIIDSIFINSYKIFELNRLPNGMYRDSKLLSGVDYHPISISNTGMGLIALCIADSMGWINNAEQLALETLKTANGHTAGFIPDRTSNGYYRHFMDINTGNQAWESEYSTVDTHIYVSGALFAKNYFQNDSVSFYVDNLWNSIDFDDAIAEPTNGAIYLSMNSDGSGVEGSLTLPYNEYMIVAWLAKNSSNDSSSPGNILWNNYYSSSSSLPSLSYNGISVLSDNTSSFLSSFVHQFNYYLCHYFTTSDAYLLSFENSQMADASSWDGINVSSSEWGHGAGSAVSNAYHADAINDNSDTIISPHIIAGYIPVNSDSKNDLIYLWNNNKGKYLLPSSNDPILWRYSNINTSWVPNEITGVDYSTMLFGICTLPEYLGGSFFSTYNDFFSIALNIEEAVKKVLKVYPNPFLNELTISLDKEYPEIKIEIFNLLGQSVYLNKYAKMNEIKVQLELDNGIYYLNLSTEEWQTTLKIQNQ